MVRALFALAFAASLAGCHKGESASCKQVGEAFVALAQKQLEEDGNAEALEDAEVGLPGVKARLVEACKEQGWSKKTRECVIKAESAKELEACRPDEAEGNEADAGS